MTDPSPNGVTMVPGQSGQPNDAVAPKPRAAKVSRTAELVSAGGLFARMIRGYFALMQGVDDAEREYGPKVYEAMMNDPAVGSSVDVLRQAAIRKPKVVPPALFQPEPGIEPNAEQSLAAEIAAFCDRALNNPRRSIEDTLFEFTYGLVEDKLAEIVLAKVTEGPDKGRLTLDRLKFKPRSSWRYVVDAYGNVGFIAGTLPPAEMPPDGYAAINVPGTGGNAILLEPDRFAVFSWATRDSDPRCRPILRRAYNAWNLKQRTWPEKLKGDTQFGTPSVAAIMPPVDQMSDPNEDEVAGLTMPDGSPVKTADDLMLLSVLAISNGSGGVFPNGTDLKVIESEREGSVLNESIKLYNGEIATAILHAPRTTQEAEHGSKADAEQSGNVTDLLVRLIGAILSNELRSILKTLVRLNFGPDAASRMVPDVVIGDTQGEDLPALITAWSSWVTTGAPTESQLAAIDASINIPPRKPGEQRIKQADAKANADAAAAMKPDPVGDAADKSDPTDKGDAKPAKPPARGKKS